MNDFDKIQNVVFDAYEQIKQADTKMKEIFYAGREVVFRRGNMKENHNARVISSGFNAGHPWIYIKNLFTGKKRNIHIDDVQGI